MFAMLMFSLTMSISPGPVNMVIISSSHGFRKTLPFVSGATIGFTLLLILVGFGFYTRNH
jgi:threonine/homoserine/homoserine lactone efflux protein